MQRFKASYVPLCRYDLFSGQARKPSAAPGGAHFRHGQLQRRLRLAVQAQPNRFVEGMVKPDAALALASERLRPLDKQGNELGTLVGKVFIPPAFKSLRRPV